MHNIYYIIPAGATSMLYNEKNILIHLQQQKIFQVSDLMKLLSCSIATAKRRLKDWNVYSSYNKNASYYTFPDIPQFNEFQLWHYRGVCFSKYGTLQKTIVALIESSKTGLNVFEAKKILEIPANNILSQYAIKNKNVYREKDHGIYIYYSTDPEKYQKQKEQREKIHHNFKNHQLPSDAEAVVILVELIKHPEDTLEQLARRAKIKGASVTVEKIHHLLDYHDLLKKNMA
jgi:hypothetical protein